MRYRKKNHRENNPDREMLAERILSTAFHAARDEEPNTSDPAAIRMKVEARAARSTRKEHTIMSRITESVKTHPALGTSVIAVAAILLFAVLVPLPYSSIVGYNVTLSGFESGTAVNVAQVSRALSALGYEQASVGYQKAESAIEFTVSGLPTRQAARETAAIFRAFTGATPQYTIEPVRKRVSGTLYAQVADRFFRVEVDGSGKTDEQIADEIAGQLQAQGLTNANVVFESTPDGQKQITVEYEGEGTSTIEFEFDSTK